MSALSKWKRGECYIGAEWNGWLVGPVSIHRDSDLLTQSNWEVSLKAIQAHSRDVEDNGESTEGVQVVTENHWAVGWVSWLAIHPSCVEAVAEAERIAEKLESYPVLDEMHWSELEFNDYCRNWQSFGHREFIQELERAELIEEGACDECAKEATREAFEALLPSGEYHDNGAPNISYAIDRAKRGGLSDEVCELLGLEFAR